MTKHRDFSAKDTQVPASLADLNALARGKAHLRDLDRLARSDAASSEFHRSGTRVTENRTKRYSVSRLVLKAVVIYNSIGFAERADAMLRRVGGRVEVNIEWTVLSWSIDALNEGNCAERVLTQARDAHLIVVPSTFARSIPRRLLGWLGRWAKLRHIATAALGILHEANSRRADTPIQPGLREFVRRHGVTMISSESVYRKSPRTSKASPARERQPRSPGERHAHGGPNSPGPCRYFGIND